MLIIELNFANVFKSIRQKTGKRSIRKEEIGISEERI